ncbi:MAG: hypothetical protein DRJ03_03520 [Chloroflexi bacterium]|nr:MAG: hypothetical protein DRJ03_03520 [Chloroflexota bacterium]
MAENRLGIGDIILPADTPNDLRIAIEEFMRRVEDNVNYLLFPQLVSVTAAYTATDLDSAIIVDATSGAVTVTLPDAATVDQKILTIKKIDNSNNVTVDGNGSQTIDGSATQVLSTQYEALTIQSDGSNWYILANK